MGSDIKFNIKRFYLYLISASLLFTGLLGCQKSDNNSSPAATPVAAPPPPVVANNLTPVPGHQYNYINSLCYDITTNTQVDIRICQTYLGGGVNGALNPGITPYGQYPFGLNGVNCPPVAGQPYPNGQPGINNTYCLNTTPYPGQCVGLYVYYQNGFFQSVSCFGNYCKGRTLIEYYTGKQVNCL